MKLSLNIALFVATCLVVCRAQTGSFFNCKNPGNNCINGVCDYSNAVCACNTGYEGESCHIFTANKCTSLSCGVNGVCETRSGVDQCVCNAGYSGASCEIAPMNCQCLSNRMIVSLTPPGDFSNGEGYVENYSAEPTCNTARSGNTHTISVDYLAGRCGTATRRDLSNGYAYSRVFVYRYNRIIRTGTDIRFQCNCIFDPSNNVLYASFGNINPNDLSNLIFQNVTNYISPITYTMTTPQNVPITSATALKIGDEIVLTFFADSGYCAVFDRLVASSPGIPSNQAVLIENGCVTKTLGESVVKPNPLYNSAMSQFRVNLFAFLFDNSNSLQLSIFYRSSTDRTQCSLPTCPTTGRKKRDTAAAQAEENVINQTIYINTPYEQSGITDRKNEECTMSSNVMIGLIVLAAIICVLLVVCFIFGLRMLMARNKNKTVN
ncbi:EGF-like domain-containing protein 2 [Haliotis asinina]|uniref:EGF-like domain-containing protein 2 n=1 Tax=Haliotis asinina TaxID=109174 RepID=UPI003531B2CA